MVVNGNSSISLLEQILIKNDAVNDQRLVLLLGMLFINEVIWLLRFNQYFMAVRRCILMLISGPEKKKNPKKTFFLKHEVKNKKQAFQRTQGLAYQNG